MIDVHLDEDAKTLVIEWNNRDLRGRSNLLTGILCVFWLFAIGLFGFSVWVLATGRNVGHPVAMWFAIAISPVFIIAIPIRILGRFSRERVEFSEQLYRLYSVEYPWLAPTKWPVDRITKFTIGHHANAQGQRETMVTLNAWRGWRRSMIGYWLDDGLKHRLFEVIARYFRMMGRSVPFEENYDEENFGPPDRGD